MTKHSLNFPTEKGTKSIELSSGEVLLVAGPNGVGKSALLESLYRSLPTGSARYIPGHRQINFNESWDITRMDLNNLQNSMYSNGGPHSRYRDHHAEDQFRLMLKTLMGENSYELTELYFALKRNDPGAQEKLRTSNTPFEKLNNIFSLSNFVVRFEPSRRGISAKRGNDIYEIEALSDGERAALYLAAGFITQRPNTVIFVDEPEKHLHPSISGTLIQAILRMRDDIAVVLATHDVHLIELLKAKSILHVRNSNVTSTEPETRQYDASLIEGLGDISEELKRDLLGVRSKILFVEGTHTSDDMDLYRHIYPDMQITPKGSCEQVIEAVRALHGLDEGHWLRPFGVIDSDGRNEGEISYLATSGIFALPFPSIENVFFLEEAIECYVSSDLIRKAGLPQAERVSKLGKAVFAAMSTEAAEIAPKLASWRLSKALSSQARSPRALKEGATGEVIISVADIIHEASLEVERAARSGDWKQVLHRLPIKSTKLAHQAAYALGALSFDDYKKVILRQLDIKSSAGEKLLIALRGKLPNIDQDSRGRSSQVFAFPETGRP